uniref:Uncharacterized protein n=1 Tax=Aegilops tauschii subsp. strangulata TaxID=200361 RepID=A0A453BGT7_AEGTS
MLTYFLEGSEWSPSRSKLKAAPRYHICYFVKSCICRISSVWRPKLLPNLSLFVQSRISGFLWFLLPRFDLYFRVVQMIAADAEPLGRASSNFPSSPRTRA